MQIVLVILKKYWSIVLLALIGIYFLVKRVLKRTPESPSQNASELLENIQIDSSLDSDEEKRKFKDIALNVARHMGTSYPAWDPRSWSENDLEVYRELKDLDKNQFEVVKILYNQVYAKGRDLSQDLSKNLDDKYYKLLNYR